MALPRMVEVSHPRQPAPLGVRAPAGSPPRAARTSPSGTPLASVDLWPCATRFRALHTGEVVCAIPDLRAVGSALLRIRLRAVGSFGRAGHTAHATVVHGCAIAHTAEAMPPRLPGHAKLTREWSQRYGCLRSGRRTGPCSHAQTDVARLHGPRLALGCQATFWPPSARQRARTDAAPCLISSPPRGSEGRHRRRCALPVPLVFLTPKPPCHGASHIAYRSCQFLGQRSAPPWESSQHGHRHATVRGVAGPAPPSRLLFLSLKYVAM